jgi:KUP system potassium uptake protein
MVRERKKATVEEILWLSCQCAGVAGGDQGTSPLYVVSVAIFAAAHTLGGEVSEVQIKGVISLIVWTLIITFVAYQGMFIQITDSEVGRQGGSMAYLKLARQLGSGFVVSLLIMKMIALTVPDFALTSAISFLAAWGGLRVAFEALPQWTIVLFSLGTAVWFYGWLQKKGVGSIAKFFGPFTLFFCTLVIVFSLGGIAQNIKILDSFNPFFAVTLLNTLPWWGQLSVLAGVMLSITGVEASQLDRDNFVTWDGSKFSPLPIQIAFAVITLTGIVSALGQGAWLLNQCSGGVLKLESAPNSFFGLLPASAVIPMVGVSVIQVVIAAQATTTGAFNLLSELQTEGLWFRLRKIFPDNSSATHDFYSPEVNTSLLWASIVLILVFQSDEKLAGAYGASVILGMLLSCLIAFLLQPKKLREEGKKKQATLNQIGFGLFFIFLIPFCFAGVAKFHEGGWITLTSAALFFILIESYRWGEKALKEATIAQRNTTISELYSTYPKSNIIGVMLVQLNGDVFCMDSAAPIFLREYCARHGCIPESLVAISINTTEEKVNLGYRFQISECEAVISIKTFWGWGEQPDLPRVLKELHYSGYMVICGRPYIQGKGIRFQSYFLTRRYLATQFWKFAGFSREQVHPQKFVVDLRGKNS